MITVAVFGSAGFAREVADVALACGHRVCLIARDVAEQVAVGEAVGNAYDVRLEEPSLFLDPSLRFAIGIGENATRRAIAERYRDRVEFMTLIHPSATFGRGQQARVASSIGTVVCAGVRFTNSIRLGDFGVFNLNATIGHDVRIGAYVNVAPGANISGAVHLDDECWIGTNAAVNQGTLAVPLVIGARTMIGAGAVVTASCDADAVYAGVPARRIR